MLHTAPRSMANRIFITDESRPRLHQPTLTTTIIPITSCSTPVRGRRRYGILTTTCALAARLAPHCGLAGTRRGWRILIATVIQITSCSTPVRGRRRYGILTTTCALAARLALHCGLAGTRWGVQRLIATAIEIT